MGHVFAITLMFWGPCLYSAEGHGLLTLGQDGFSLDIYEGDQRRVSRALTGLRAFGLGARMIFTVDTEGRHARLDAWDLETGEPRFHHISAGMVPGFVQGPSEQVFYDSRHRAIVFTSLSPGAGSVLEIVDVETQNAAVVDIPMGRRYPVLSPLENGVLLFHRRSETLLFFDYATRVFSRYPLAEQATSAFDHLGFFEGDRLAPEPEPGRVGFFRTDGQRVWGLYGGSDSSRHVTSFGTTSEEPVSIEIPFETRRIIAIRKDTVFLYDTTRHAIVATDYRGGTFKPVLEVESDTIDIFAFAPWK